MDVEDTEAIAARTAELVAGAVRDEAWPFVAAAVHVAVTVSGLGQHFVSSTALLADSLLAYLVQAPCSAETWAPSQPLSAVERILGEDSEDDAPASAAVMTLGRLVVLIERKTGRGLGDGPMAQLAEAVIRARSFWRHQSPRIVRACGVMLFGSAETDIKDVSALVERDPSLIRLVLDLISDERSTNELRRRAFAVCERLDLVACSSLSRIAIAHVNAERRGSIDGELVSKSLFGTVARALTTGDKRAKQTDKAGMVKIMQMLGQVDPRLFVIDSVPMPTWSDRLYPALVVHHETWSAVVIEMSHGLTRLSKVATLTDDSHLLWTVFQVAWTVLPAQPYKKIAQCLSGGYLEAIVRTMLAGDAVASSATDVQALTILHALWALVVVVNFADVRALIRPRLAFVATHVQRGIAAWPAPGVGRRDYSGLISMLWQMLIHVYHLDDVRNGSDSLRGCRSALCGKRDVKLLDCAACRATAYCSAKCARRDWREGMHRELCPLLRWPR